MPKQKYKKRPDGRYLTTRTYHSKVFDGRKQFYGRTCAEVDEAIEAFEEWIENGGVTKEERKVSSIAEKWWRDKEPEISINTVHGYKVAMERTVVEFGDMDAAEVTPQEIYAFLKRFAAQGYSQKVISNTKIILKEIFDTAFVAGIISGNPVVALPPVKGKRKVPREPAADEDIKLIEQFRDENLISRLFYFMLYTGMRVGEASALQQKHIDRKHKTARVEQALAWGNGNSPTIKEPKTAAGYRTVDLLDCVLEILPEYDDPETYIFFPDGFRTRSVHEKALDKWRDSHGIKATAHQLRHAYASMLHSAGIDVKDAQALLGHSTVAMTQDVYTHLEREHRACVTNQLNRYVENRKNSL